MRKHNLQQRLLLLLIFVLLISCTVDGGQINDATVTPLPVTPTVQPQQQDESGASVVEKLHSAEIEITDIHTHEEDSFFDLLFGEDVTEWIRLSADGETLNIYEFASADAVAAALAARQGNGYLFRLTRADGTIAQMNLNGNPYFWQDGSSLIHVPLASQELTEKLESAVGASLPWHTGMMPEQAEVRVRVYNDSDVDFDSVEVGWAETQQIGAVPARGYSDYFTFEYAYHYGYVVVLVDGKEYSFRPIDYVGESYLAAGDYTFALTPVDGDEYDHLATQMVRDGGAVINPHLTDKRWYWATAMTQDGAFHFPTSGNAPYIELTRNPVEDRMMLNVFDGCETFSIAYQLGVQYGIVTFDMPEPTCGDAHFFSLIDTLTHLEAGDQFLRLHTTAWDSIIMTQAEPTGSHFDPAALAPTMLKVQYFDGISMATPQFADSAAWTFDYFDQEFTAHIFADGTAAQAATLQSEDMVWLFENVLITYRPNPNSRIGSLKDMLTDAFGRPHSDSGEEAISVKVEQPFELGIGESADFRTAIITLTAVTEDSRCPVDVDCFWAGEATVEFATSTGESFALVIGGGNGVDARAAYQIGELLLQIEALSPEPHSEQPIAPADYRATLRLRAMED